MGKSNSIQQQEVKNTQFQEYVTKMNSDMDARQEALQRELEEMEKKHYESISDKTLLLEGRYSHLTTVSEWSLKSVSAIIDSCSKALLGMKKSAPAGSKIEEIDEKTSESITAIKERERYIANEAFSVVQAIVGSFNSSTSTSIEKKTDAKPIAPGMTLFIGVENNSFSSQNFFSNETIIQTIFVFKVCYSIQEGKRQSALSDLQVYEDQKERYRKTIEKLGQKEMELDIEADDYLEKFNQLEDTVKLLSERLKEITGKISELMAIQLAQDNAACNRILEQMRVARLGFECVRNGNSHKRTSRAFTYTDGRDRIYELVRRGIPAYVHLVSVTTTDYVGNHFKAVFASDDPITLDQANRWVSDALSGTGNFRFD